MIYFAGIIFGITSVRNISVRLLPPLPVPELTVLAVYEGYTAEEIRALVTIPLENALSSVKGVRKINSASTLGKSVLTIHFHWKTDLETAGLEIREVIDNSMGILPADMARPVVLSLSPGEEALMWIAVMPEGGKLTDIRKLCDQELRNRFRQIPGVAAVMSFGGTLREIKIKIDREKALHYGLSYSVLKSQLRQANISYPGGRITEGERDYIIKTDGRIEGLEELSELIIVPPAKRENPPDPVILSDIADIEIGTAEQTSVFHYNGREGVVLLIYGQQETSPVALSKHIRERIEELKNSFGNEISLHIIKDASGAVTESVRDMIFSGLTGAGVVAFIIILFLKRRSGSIILLLSLPWSICFAFILLYISGRSINTMSLGGLVIGIGMIVDNGIVMIERILSGGEITVSAAEITPALIGSTLTTIIVFLPVPFLPGLIGLLFTDLALSVCFSLVGSLLCSVVIVPVLFYFFSMRRAADKPPAQARAILRPPGMSAGTVRPRTEMVYRNFLGRLLRRPGKIFPVFLFIAFIGCLSVIFVKTTLFAPVHTDTLIFTVDYPPGLIIDELRWQNRTITEELYETGLFHSVSGICGFEKDNLLHLADTHRKPNRLEIRAHCKKGSAAVYKETVLKSLRKKGNNSLHVNFEFKDPIMNLLGNSYSGMETAVTAATQTKAREKGEELIDLYLKPLLPEDQRNSIALFPSEETAAVYLRPLRDALTRARLNLSGVSTELETDLSGSIPTKIKLEDLEYRVNLMGNGGRERTVNDVSELPLGLSGGQFIRTGMVFDMEQISAPRLMLREDRKDYVFVRIPERVLSEEIASTLRTVSREQKNVYSREDSVIRQNSIHILYAFSAALILLYFVLGAQFESFIKPLFVFIPLPPSLAGILFSLLISGRALDVYASLGILVLLGLSINNSIFLFAAYDRHLSAGYGPAAAVYLGSTQRIRPILITTLTTAAALIPMAIDPFHTSRQSGMASVIIGGLIFSSFATVMIQPCIYRLYIISLEKNNAGKKKLAPT